ncbi:hypothetical protein ACFPC0_10795 [Streptomyces andamanensis]|uniref:Uncharacterized protein n=1 Tax=Streptomyces andamanensis TaxID=1565035 RepID=A0ABV8TCK3_9ACTN
MMWPLSAPAVAVVAVVTLSVSAVSLVRAGQMRRLTTGAVLSGNRDAIAATQRRARRFWHRHLMFGVPLTLLGISLLTTQAVACLVVALPR